MYEEKRFLTFLKKYPQQTLPKIYLIGTEIPLYRFSDLIKATINSRTNFEENKFKIKKRIIGRIDLVFRYESVNYCGEIKYYPYKGCDFWDALKVVGYAAYYSKCVEQCFKPAIFIPRDKIFVETLIVARKLNLAIFAIIGTKRYYKVEFVGEKFKPNY